MNQKQIQQEIQLLSNHRLIQNIQKISNSEYLLTFIFKNSQSIYANIRWELDLKLSEDYPYSPPQLKFTGRIYHLNIKQNGTIRLGLLEQQWCQMSTIYNLIDELENILQYPDTNYAASDQMLDFYLNHKQQYRQQCQKVLHIHRPKISRIDSQGKAQIEQEISGLNKMKLTEFAGLSDFDFDVKISVPIHLKNQIKNAQVPPQFMSMNFSRIDSKFRQNQTINSKDSYLKPPSMQSLKIVKQIKNKQSHSYKKNQQQRYFKQQQKTGLQNQNKEKRQIKNHSKMNRQIKLNSITQYIRGQDASNTHLFDLSVSKDFTNGKKQFKHQKNKQFSHSSQSNQHKIGKLTLQMKQLIQSQYQKQSFVNTKSKQKISKIRQKTITNIKPSLYYEQIKFQVGETQKMFQKVSQQIWQAIERIDKIQQNMKLGDLSRNTILQRILTKKLHVQLENLQKLQQIEQKLKSKIVYQLKYS